MEIVNSTRPKQKILQAHEFSHSIFFYKVPPMETISLQMFEELAFDRLKILKAVEKVGLQYSKSSKEYADTLHEEMRKLTKDGSLKNIFSKSQDRNEEMRSRTMDNTSHFILRLAYCRTEELKRWFINQETDLFRYRLLQLSGDQMKKFLMKNDINYKPISDEEKTRLKRELVDGTAGFNMEKFKDTHFYKVYFTEVLELMRSMRVFVSEGFAFVPQNEFVICILNLFRSKLSKDLALTVRTLPRVAEDTRLAPMLSSLSRQYVGEDYSKKTSGGHVTAEMIDGLSKSSFPLCMQDLHRALKEMHHLKHWGRMQYGLFLKGIGLTLEEAMKFWRQEFTKIMDGERFMKEYAYNIRYNYGKEGKRSNYTPHSCLKIIMSNQPSVGDHHGCPFRHSDAETLRQKLKAAKISSDGINEILGLVKQGHFQPACGRYFDLKHDLNGRFIPNHPNQYFEESQRILNGSDGESISQQETAKVKLVPVATKQHEDGMEWDEDDANLSLAAETFDSNV